MTHTGLAPRFTITNSITLGLTAIERARGFLEAATLSGEWIERMSRRALLLEAHHTTHIEGTHLTLAQAERLWAGEKVQDADRDDARELLNYRDAFNLVSEYLGTGEPITESLIREIHKRLVSASAAPYATPVAIAGSLALPAAISFRDTRVVRRRRGEHQRRRNGAHADRRAESVADFPVAAKGVAPDTQKRGRRGAPTGGFRRRLAT